MKYTFKTGQRIKRGALRGTVQEILRVQGFAPKQYVVHMDNGARVMGTGYQFQPVRVHR
jgi:hypothetical protein